MALGHKQLGTEVVFRETYVRFQNCLVIVVLVVVVAADCLDFGAVCQVDAAVVFFGCLFSCVFVNIIAQL